MISRTPWTWQTAKILPGCEFPRCRILDATGEEIARLEPRERFPRQRADGNAALMAGAPVLLEALQSIRTESREALRAAAMGEDGGALLVKLCDRVEGLALEAVTAGLHSRAQARGADF